MLHSYLLSVGGFTGREVLDTVECYDPSSDAWTRVLTMSTPRSGVKVVAHKDIIYVIGGYNGVTRLSSSMLLVFNSVQLFSPWINLTTFLELESESR